MYRYKNVFRYLRLYHWMNKNELNFTHCENQQKINRKLDYYALITAIQLFLLQVLFSMPVLFLCFLKLPFTKLHVCFQLPTACRAINLEQIRESVSSFNYHIAVPTA